MIKNVCWTIVIFFTCLIVWAWIVTGYEQSQNKPVERSSVSGKVQDVIIEHESGRYSSVVIKFEDRIVKLRTNCDYFLEISLHKYVVIYYDPRWMIITEIKNDFTKVEEKDL